MWSSDISVFTKQPSQVQFWNQCFANGVIDQHINIIRLGAPVSVTIQSLLFFLPDTPYSWVGRGSMEEVCIALGQNESSRNHSRHFTSNLSPCLLGHMFMKLMSLFTMQKHPYHGVLLYTPMYTLVFLPLFVRLLLKFVKRWITNIKQFTRYLSHLESHGLWYLGSVRQQFELCNNVSVVFSSYISIQSEFVSVS